MPAVTTTNPNVTTTQAPAPTLPYVQANNALLPVVPKPKAVTTQDLQQGSNTVMQAAQQTALAKANQPDQTMGLVQQGVQELLKNPMGQNYNAQKQQQSQLEQFDRNRAQSMQAFQQQNADIANTGINREAAYNFAMQGAQGRSDLESKLAAENADKERAAMLDALKLGAGTAQTQSGLDTEAFNRLINARGAFEGERAQSQSFQDNVALTNLGFDHQMQLSAQQQGFNLESMNQQFGNEMTKMIAGQNWQGAQSALDREAAQLAQSTDLAAKQTFQEKQNAFDMLKLNATQDWQGAQNKIAQDLQLAMQANDIQATSANIQKQLDLDKWKQENGQTFTADQAEMNRSLELSLKTMDMDSQRELMNLKAEIDKGTQLRGQDFEATQHSLDLAWDKAKAEGNIQAQKDIEALRGQIEMQAQAAQQQWQSNERIASEGWQTNERMDNQQFEAVNKQLDRELATATQANDIAAQERLTRYKGALDLKMQTQAMDQEQKMAYLNSNLAEARANNDVVRQEALLTFQFGQDMQKIVQEQGFTAGQAYLDRQMEQAMQDKDITAQKMLQVQRLTTQVSEAAKDRTLEQARIALQGRQIDMQGQQMTFDQIEAAIAAGQIDPQAALTAVQNSAAQYGITIQAPDPNAAIKAVEAQFDAQRAEFLQTHPEYVGSDGNMNEAGQTAFNKFYNDTIYGASMAAADLILDPTKLQGAADPASPNHDSWLNLYNTASPASNYTAAYSWSDDQRKFTGAVPAAGTLIKSESAKLYVATGTTGKEKHGTGDKPTNYYEVRDVSTGAILRIWAGGTSINGLAK